MVKKALCVVLMGVLGLSGSLWAVGDEQEDRNARLWKAVQTDDLEGAEKAIEDGADLDMRAADGSTLLFNAVTRNSSKIARLLLYRGARMHFSIDLIRNKLLQQGSPENASKPMSDRDVTKNFMLVAIEQHNSHILHVMFEDIARNPNPEEAYTEAVEFIRMVKDKHFTVEGQKGIIMFAAMRKTYLQPLQHLIVRFSDEKTITLFLNALKEVCGEHEAKQILFSHACPYQLIIRHPTNTASNYLPPPFELLVSECLNPSRKEHLLSFLKVVDAVLGEETIKDVLHPGGCYLHRLLEILMYPDIGIKHLGYERYSVIELRHSVPLFLEAMYEYLGEDFLNEWFSTRDIQGRYPLDCVRKVNHCYPCLHPSNHGQYLQTFYTPLSVILKTTAGRLYCSPMLVDIEEDLDEGQHELILAVQLLKKLIDTSDEQYAYLLSMRRPDPNRLSDTQRLDLLLESENLFQALLDNLPNIEDEESLMQLIDNLFVLINENQLMESPQIDQNREKLLFAMLLCQVKAISEAIHIWKTAQTKSAKSVIPSQTGAKSESKKKPVNARPSDEWREKEPARKKQRTLLDKFNREDDGDDDDGDEFELYSDDDDSWEYTETEYVDAGLERVGMEGEGLMGFTEVMQGVDFGYGERGEEQINGAAHQAGSH